MPELDRFYRDNSRQAGILAVAVQDGEEAIGALMDTGGFNFPLMLEPGGMAAGYGISVIPTLVIIDPSGNVAKEVSQTLTAEELAKLVSDVAAR